MSDTYDDEEMMGDYSGASTVSAKTVYKLSQQLAAAQKEIAALRDRYELALQRLAAAQAALDAAKGEKP